MPILSKHKAEVTGRPPRRLGYTLGARLATILVTLASCTLLVSAERRYASEVLSAEADVLTKQQLYSRAIESASSAIAQNPYNGYAYYHLGYATLVLERSAEAIEILRQGLPYMPHLPQILKMLGQAYFFVERFEDAAAIFDRYLAMDPAPRAGADSILRFWARSLSASQQFGRATVALAKAETYEAYRSELLQNRLLNSVLLNQPNLADYYYRTFRHLVPSAAIDPVSLFAQALAAQKLAALVQFLEVNRIRGEKDPMAEKLLAMAYAKQGRLREAIAVLTAAARLLPEDPEIPLFLGDAYFQLGEKEQACLHYRRHLELAPQSPFRDELAKKFPELHSATRP